MAKMMKNTDFTTFVIFPHYMRSILPFKCIEEMIQAVPYLRDSKTSIQLFTKWVFGSYQT